MRLSFLVIVPWTLSRFAGTSSFQNRRMRSRLARQEPSPPPNPPPSRGRAPRRATTPKQRPRPSTPPSFTISRVAGCQRLPGKINGRGGLGLWRFFDRVDAIGVKGEIMLDRRDGGVGSLITPHRVDRALAAERDAEIAAIALVRAVGGVVGTGKE